jgi:protease IV
MERRAAWVLGIVFGGLFLCLFAFLFLMFAAVRGDSGGRRLSMGDRVGVIEVVGPIADSKKTLEHFAEFEHAEHIMAVVLRVDSPGGGVAPSQEIYDAVKRVRKSKPVFASMGSTAASGGYYIAAAAEKIFANPGTLTGSIGVIFQLPNFEGVMKWAGVSMVTITAGKMKDSGSPFRTMTDEERAYFEGVLRDVHEQFLGSVAEGRALKVEEVRPYADGRVFTGRQAKEWKLVDELGGIEDAVRAAGKAGGISGDAEAEFPKEKRPWLQELLGDEVRSVVRGASAEITEQLGGTGLQYRLLLPAGR